MTVHHQDDRTTIHHGDSLDVLRELPDASVDAIVTDPPYGLGFMGQKWDTYAHESGRAPSSNQHRFDHVGGNHNPSNSADAARTRRVEAQRFGEWCELWTVEALRVLKPGGHLLAFGGTRTWHRLAVAVEDAGFEVRDSIAWLYGSGFPKSLSVHGATLKAVGSRYGSARCVCMDPRDGCLDRDRLGRQDRRDVGASGGSGQVPAQEARPADLPFVEGRDLGALRKLREGDSEEAARPATFGAPVLLSHLCGCRSEAARLGDVALRGGLEEPTSGDPAPGQGLPGLRQDARGERLCAACAPPTAVPVRGDEPAGEPSGAVRQLPPHDRGRDESGVGVDPSRRDPRWVHSDGDGRGRGAVARVCSWCGLPDFDWLTSLEPLGTALKPAFEPIVVARKPLTGTVAANVLAHGTGALNIDGTRVATTDKLPGAGGEREMDNEVYGKGLGVSSGRSAELGGRWPANVLLDGSQAEALDEQSGTTSSVGKPRKRGDSRAVTQGATRGGTSGGFNLGDDERTDYGDSGGASRFFPTFRYQAKAPTRERPTVVTEDGTKTAHPTVKPLALMRWLVRLVTPPGGTVLDPFAGSGATIEAAIQEGFYGLGIEREDDYLPLIAARLARVRSQARPAVRARQGARRKAASSPVSAAADELLLFDGTAM